MLWVLYIVQKTHHTYLNNNKIYNEESFNKIPNLARRVKDCTRSILFEGSNSRWNLQISQRLPHCGHMHTLTILTLHLPVDDMSYDNFYLVHGKVLPNAVSINETTNHITRVLHAAKLTEDLLRMGWMQMSHESLHFQHWTVLGQISTRWTV